MTARRRIPRKFYAVVCKDDVDNSLFGGLPSPELTRTLRDARWARAWLDRHCCDDGHRILRLTVEAL